MAKRSTDEPTRLGLQGAWSMAVGGMVGGGIFSTLGVVISVAGGWAWLSFVLAGLVALGAGYAYVQLAAKHGRGGGAFTYLRLIGATEFAGSLAWVLTVGYVLTNAVYAITFGDYLGHVLGLSAWFPHAAAIAIMAVFIGLNLRGVGEAGGVEVFLVWFKLVVLVALATWGLAHWQPSMLWRGVPEPGLGVAMYGAATVFMAYEGFQLLTYDYDDIERPERTLSRAVLIAIPVVIAVYVLVALGTAMLIGADEIVRNEEVALAVAGERAAGVTGLVIVTIGAAFSTGSAINSTLFATARLAHEVARNGQLPAVIDHRNRAGVPDRAVVGLGAAAAVLAGLGSLTLLVEAASLAFLLTFAVVCGVAFYERAGARVVTGLGALGATACAVTLMVRMIRLEPLALLILGLLVAVATIGRPWILRHVTTNTSDSARPTPSRPATALSRVSSAVQPPQGSNCPEPGASPSSNSGI